jgi:hypothetical protein
LTKQEAVDKKALTTYFEIRRMAVKKAIIYIGIFILTIGLMGCKKSIDFNKISIGPAALTTPLAVLQSSDATIQVLDCETDSISREVSMNLFVTWLDNSSEPVKLVAKPLTPVSYDLKAKIYLNDGTDNILFGYVIEFDTTVGGGLQITEYTKTDEMICAYKDNGVTTMELCAINGVHQEYEYPSISLASKQATVDYYKRFEKPPILNKMAPGQPHPEISEAYLQTLIDFDSFYSPTMNNSLHNNREGKLLTFLLTNQAVSDIIEDELGLPTGPSLKKICELCDICTLIKCLYGGGAANQVCGICAACSFACLVVKLLFGSL